MAQYINKDTLVAEIENRKDSFYSLSESCEKGTPAKAGFYAQAQTLEGILSFLNTIEVKEAVDVEIVEVEDNNNSIYAYTHLEICTDEDLSKICKAGDKAKVIIEQK